VIKIIKQKIISYSK